MVLHNFYLYRLVPSEDGGVVVVPVATTVYEDHAKNLLAHVAAEDGPGVTVLMTAGTIRMARRGQRSVGDPAPDGEKGTNRG